MKRWALLLAVVWVSQQFATIADLTNFLNTLSPDRAIEAKVLVINSQRSFMGVLSSPYFLIYREEKK